MKYNVIKIFMLFALFILVFSISPKLTVNLSQDIPNEFNRNKHWMRAELAARFYMSGGDYIAGFDRGCRYLSRQQIDTYITEYYLNYNRSFKGQVPQEFFLSGQ